jgi:hypothetical protein
MLDPEPYVAPPEGLCGEVHRNRECTLNIIQEV